jgi:hypothetical protein
MVETISSIGNPPIHLNWCDLILTCRTSIHYHLVHDAESGKTDKLIVGQHTTPCLGRGNKISMMDANGFWFFLELVRYYESAKFPERHGLINVNQRMRWTKHKTSIDYGVVCIPPRMDHLDVVGRLTPSMNGNQEFTTPRSLMSQAGPSHWDVCSC